MNRRIKSPNYNENALGGSRNRTESAVEVAVVHEALGDLDAATARRRRGDGAVRADHRPRRRG